MITATSATITTNTTTTAVTKLTTITTDVTTTYYQCYWIRVKVVAAGSLIAVAVD
jgi:hypothetical protein